MFDKTYWRHPVPPANIQRMRKQRCPSGADTPKADPVCAFAPRWMAALKQANQASWQFLVH